ncbi:MAG: hypothetical protein RBR15_13710 [Sphaerochaeta sp.]|nr:hypothetical protein [Sphaerochaeta sp.]
MSNQKCPVCSMGELQQEKRVLTLSKYGLSESREVEVSFCPVCEAESYVHEKEESVRRDMVKLLEQRNVRILLEKMAQGKTSFASLERALALPQRTLSKWKQGAINPSEAGIVLVNLLDLMPWLSQVVDNDYDPQLALSLQWANLCKSLEPIAIGRVENGFEEVLTSYARQEVRKMETEQLSSDEFYYGEVIHEIAYV